MKKLIAFDLDDTLSLSKTPMHPEIIEQFNKLLTHKLVCVISGGKFKQFEKQIINNIDVEKKYLNNLHLMPTCGTSYFIFDQNKNEWKNIYSEDIPEDDKKRIINGLEDVTKQLGYWEEKPYGDIIEDRGSQITFSALGQSAPIEEKEKWDLGDNKRNTIIPIVSKKIPDYEFRIGGTTSIDVTKPGIDKAYGMKKLIQELDLTKDEILFVGDKLQPGGNDYPVKAMGIDCIEVSKWHDTKILIETINKLS
jgi:HAD superfamily hydrolase (TIGR01484 family)